jgi:hypothetical protein
MKLLNMEFSPASCQFLPLKSNYSRSTLVSNNIKPWSSFEARNHVLCLYKFTSKIMFLYCDIYMPICYVYHYCLPLFDYFGINTAIFIIINPGLVFY